MLLPFCANARKEKGTADVYVFGVGTSFNDSVMYMSAPQRLDGALIQKKTGFLEDRTYYSFQFKNYLEANYPGYETCAVFYATSRKNIEKKYAKLRRRYRKDKELRVEEVPTNEFAFIPMKNLRQAAEKTEGKGGGTE